MSDQAQVLDVRPVRMYPLTIGAWVGGVWSVLLLAAALALGHGIVRGRTWQGLGGILYVDALGAVMLALIAFITLVAALYSAPYLRQEWKAGQVTAGQILNYYVWFQLFQVTMVAAVVVDNLGLLWVAVEATTLVSAVLVGFYNRRTSLEAAWKYVILCGVGIAFALLGVILLYFAGVQAGLDAGTALDWTRLLGAARRLNPALVRLAFAFLLLGFGTKAGLAPMHSWLPDAHSQAPSPVSAVLSGVLLNTALYAILRFHAVALRALGPEFSGNLLLTFGLISLGIAALFILVQRDLKRLLAYSSVEHVGLICVGVGLGGPAGLSGAVLHMIGHSLAKALLFLAAGNVGHRYHTFRMERLRGAVRALPVTGPLLVAGILAISGIPPAGLFLSEFSIVAAGFLYGKIWQSGLVLAALGVAFAGMMRHIREIAWGEVPPGIHAGESFQWGSLPLLLPLLLVILFGIWLPPHLVDVIRQVAGLLGG